MWDERTLKNIKIFQLWIFIKELKPSIGRILYYLGILWTLTLGGLQKYILYEKDNRVWCHKFIMENFLYVMENKKGHDGWWEWGDGCKII